MKLFISLILLVSVSAMAQCQDVDGTTQPQSQTAAAGYTPIGQWQLSVAFGMGVRSSPIHGGDSVPLYVVPSISYYDEHFYFDDATLGYSFIDTN